uniref:EF-hand domain-containing protein n=2 Tax=Alexandrium monilatum TaxID=311494 RepID=A0A7S4R720_9DINO
MPDDKPGAASSGEADTAKPDDKPSSEADAAKPDDKPSAAASSEADATKPDDKPSATASSEADAAKPDDEPSATASSEAAAAKPDSHTLDPKPGAAAGSEAVAERPDTPKFDPKPSAAVSGEAASPRTSDIGAEHTVEPPRDFWDTVVGDVKRHTLAHDLETFQAKTASRRAEEQEEESTRERLLPTMPAKHTPVSPNGSRAQLHEPSAPPHEPDRFLGAAPLAGRAPDAASDFTAAVAAAAVSKAVAEASTSVQVKPGDPILGEYDREGIRERSKERLAKKEEEEQLRERMREELKGAAADGRLTEAVANGQGTPPATPAQRLAEKASETSLARPGMAGLQALTEHETPGDGPPELGRAISPASASLVESAATPLGESLGGLLHLSAADLVSPSNLSLTGASSRMSPKVPTSPKALPIEEAKVPAPHAPEGHSPRQHLVRHSTTLSHSGTRPLLEDHKVTLYQVRKIKQDIVEREVPVHRESLNKGDSFVLDTEETIYVWHGDHSQPLEKYQATTLAEQLAMQRGLVGPKRQLPHVSHDIDRGFWEPLGGEGPVKGQHDVTDSPPRSPKLALAAQPAKAPTAKKKFVGKSPFLSAKEMEKVFEEADTTGNGLLSLQELLVYLGDYLRYGDAEVVAFYNAHAAGGGVSLDSLKRNYRELFPYNTFKLSNRVIVRKPGAFGGMQNVDMRIEECRSCSILVCDRMAEVYVDDLTDCRVLIGPCSSSTFLRNCKGCDFWVATKQFRVRDCTNCRFYLFSHTEPVIETSSDLCFAPFSAEYPGLSEHFRDAGFDPSKNRWNAVYDFNGRADGANWSIRPLDECETLVVTFSRDAAKPDSPCPAITQELLMAQPLPSLEDVGSSVTNTPQTRPPPPPPPERCHPISGILLDRPRRHLVNDFEDGGRPGQEEVDGVRHPWKALPPVIRTPQRLHEASRHPSHEGSAPAATGRTGRPFQRGARIGVDDSSDSSDGAVRPSPLARGRALTTATKVVARGAQRSDSDSDDAPPAAKAKPKAKAAARGNDSDSDDEPPAAKTRALLGSAMASRAVEGLMRRLGSDSD